MTGGSTERWLYYKVYLGHLGNRAERFVAGALRDVSLLDGVRQWFFLHYTDERGPHIRLRVEPAAGHDLRGSVEQILDRGLAQLPGLAPTPYRAVIPPLRTPFAGDPAGGRDETPHIESDRYEPDREVYGLKGVRIAEHLFCASSEAALRVLDDEHRHYYSRKTVIPLYMTSLAQAFVSDASPALWADYAAYWLAPAGDGAAEWMPRFLAKAAELRADGVAVVADDGSLPDEAIVPVRAWRAAASAASLAFRDTADTPPPSSRDLTFHFLHSMNNRLGLSPLEEAYFAALLADVGTGVDRAGVRTDR